MVASINRPWLYDGVTILIRGKLMIYRFALRTFLDNPGTEDVETFSVGIVNCAVTDRAYRSRSYIAAVCLAHWSQENFRICSNPSAISSCLRPLDATARSMEVAMDSG